MGDDALGEQLWSVDIVEFQSIAGLREKFVAILKRHLASTRRHIDCPEDSGAAAFDCAIH